MDIDIDLHSDFDPLEFFPEATRASMVSKDRKLAKHPAGVYLQNIPKDKITGLSAIPYKQAENLGYLKIDFLHLSLLDHFTTKKQIRHLIKQEPDWTLLEDESVVETLFQIHQHFDIVSTVKPKSVQELADCIALIRPAKRHLLYGYVKNRNLIRRELYTKPADGKYYFKKGHAIAYALNIVLQLHVIKQGIINIEHGSSE